MPNDYMANPKPRFLIGRRPGHQFVYHSKRTAKKQPMIDMLRRSESATVGRLDGNWRLDWIHVTSDEYDVDFVPARSPVLCERLHGQTTMFENGHVFLPSQAPWLADYENELLSFTRSRYDDQVDSTAQALAYMREPDGLEIWRRLGRN